MYIDIGDSILIDKDDIVLIMDFERLTKSTYGQKYVKNLEKEKKIFYVSFDRLPKSLIVTVNKNGEDMAFLSPISIQVINKYQIEKDYFVGENSYVCKKNSSE